MDQFTFSFKFKQNTKPYSISHNKLTSADTQLYIINNHISKKEWSMSAFHHYARLNGEIRARTNHDPECIWTCSLLSGMISWWIEVFKSLQIRSNHNNVSAEKINKQRQMDYDQNKGEGGYILYFQLNLLTLGWYKHCYMSVYI